MQVSFFFIYVFPHCLSFGHKRVSFLQIRQSGKMVTLFGNEYKKLKTERSSLLESGSASGAADVVNH